MGEDECEGEGGAVGCCVWVEWGCACVWKFDVCGGDEAFGGADGVLFYAGGGDIGRGGGYAGVEEVGCEGFAAGAEEGLDVCLCACVVLFYGTFTL